MTVWRFLRLWRFWFPSLNFGRLEKGRNRQGVRLHFLPRQASLETCLERPFSRTIARELLHSKQQKECNSFSSIANYCVARTIARTIATDKNYCGNTPCGIHPFSELPKLNNTPFRHPGKSHITASCPRKSLEKDKNRSKRRKSPPQNQQKAPKLGVSSEFPGVPLNSPGIEVEKRLLRNLTRHPEVYALQDFCSVKRP